jgi:hypothetical protein
MMSYIILFHHIWKHNNNVASIVLDQKIVLQRNKANAMNLTGLFATWVTELVYPIFVGLLFFVVPGHNNIRDVVGTFKWFDYFLIPFIQVHTSPPLRRYLEAN